MRGFVTPSYTEWFAKGILGAVKETDLQSRSRMGSREENMNEFLP